VLVRFGSKAGSQAAAVGLKSHPDAGPMAGETWEYNLAQLHAKQQS